MINITTKGFKELAGRLAKYPKLSKKAFDDTIDESISEAEKEVISRTPLDTGELRAGYKKNFGLLTGKLFNPLKYAIKQHETLSFKHKVGEAKFMEKGLDKSVGKINRLFEKALDKLVKELA